MLIAQANLEALTLVSGDQRLTDYGANVINREPFMLLISMQ
jgi:PIN domain nuclease of toxin-antitoxin system